MKKLPISSLLFCLVCVVHSKISVAETAINLRFSIDTPGRLLEHKPPLLSRPDTAPAQHDPHQALKNYRPPTVQYRDNNMSIDYVVPFSYQSPHQSISPPPSATVIQTTTVISPQQPPIDAWAALGQYQTKTAIEGFQAQYQDDPNAILPKIGYALAVATAGEYDKAVEAMLIAFRYPSSSLKTFKADFDLQLVLKELLFHYENEAFMSASLLYLLQDMPAAKDTIQEAKFFCHQCASIENLHQLIQQSLPR